MMAAETQDFVELCFVVPKTAVLGGVTLALTKLGTDLSASTSSASPSSSTLSSTPAPSPQPQTEQKQQQRRAEKVFSVGLVAAPNAAEGALYVLDSSFAPANSAEAAALSATTRCIAGRLRSVSCSRVTALAVPRAELQASVADADLRAALLAATPAHPLALQPVWGFGTPPARACEEPEAGTGWVFSWRTAVRSSGRGFGLQRWGYALSLPQRVVAFHPTFRGIVYPLLEMPAASSRDALDFLAWCGVAEATPGYSHAEWYASLLRRPDPVFGRPPLHDEDADADADAAALPEIVEECVEFLAARAAVLPGVFRIAAPSEELRALVAAYDARPPASTPAGSAARETGLSNVSDPHSVAGLLKAYLRSLPEPLVPWDLCVALGAEGDASKNVLGTMVENLPRANAAVLRALVGLARRIASESKTSLMDAPNLAKCLAPSITRKTPGTEVMSQEEAAQLPSVLTCFAKLFAPQP